MVLCYKVILNNVNMTIRAQTLQNLNAVQYIRWNIKREGFCEIYNVRPLAISAEAGSHSNAPGSIKIPQKCYSSSKRRVCNMSCRSHASLQSIPQIINPNVTQCVFCIIRLNHKLMRKTFDITHCTFSTVR